MRSELSAFEFAADPEYTRRLMRTYASMFEGGLVADLGSGRGYFLEALRERDIAGVGVDNSEEAIEAARTLGFECQRADVLDFLASARDLQGIFASHLIEHLEPQAAEGLVAGAARALQSGGTFVVVTPNLADYRTLSEIFWLDVTHRRPYPPRLVAAMMQRHGFTVEAIGRGRTPQGRRAILRVALGRIRFGRDYGVSEVWVRARRQ